MDRDLAAAVHKAAYLRGTFRLRSGQTANEYFDKYRFESDPHLLRRICEALAPLVPASTELLAGLELGGVPVATMLSQVTNIPVVFVRKEAKSYGTEQFAEGAPIKGKRLTVVEDIMTTGGQVVASVGALRAAGAVVEDVMCVIDREAGAVAALQKQGLRLHALFRYGDLVTRDSPR